MRSPEAYERLREKVKGPEDLEQEMDRSEKLAELHLALESEPTLKQSLKSSIEKDIAEQGIESVLDTENISPEAKQAIEQKNFTASVESHPQTHEDALVILSEGNVQEKIPVKQVYSEKYAKQLLQKRF